MPRAIRQAKKDALFRHRVVLHTETVISADTWNAMPGELPKYLEAINLKLRRVSEQAPLQVRLTAFPHLMFMHMYGPQFTAEWPRDALSVDRAVLVIVAAGSAAVNGEQVNAGQVALINPGETEVTVETLCDRNELMTVSFGAHKLEGLPILGTATGPVATTIAGRPLKPLLAFIASLCDLEVAEGEDPEPLLRASQDVVRSLVQAIVGAAPEAAPLYERALHTLEREYLDLSLNARSVALALGVSERALQTEFAAHGETLASSLRQVRARAAVANRDANPNLAAASIARMSGFGSESTMYRAIRELQSAKPQRAA